MNAHETRKDVRAAMSYEVRAGNEYGGSKKNQLARPAESSAANVPARHRPNQADTATHANNMIPGRAVGPPAGLTAGRPTHALAPAAAATA